MNEMESALQAETTLPDRSFNDMLYGQQHAADTLWGSALCKADMRNQ